MHKNTWDRDLRGGGKQLDMEKFDCCPKAKARLLPLIIGLSKSLIVALHTFINNWGGWKGGKER
jgi:hypothetical protein